MSKIKMTVQQIKDLGLWEKVCDYKGIDPRISLNTDGTIEFNTEFKDKDVIKNSIALERVNLQIISNNIFGVNNDVDILEIQGDILLKELEETYKKLGDLLQRVKDNINSNKEE